MRLELDARTFLLVYIIPYMDGLHEKDREFPAGEGRQK